MSILSGIPPKPAYTKIATDEWEAVQTEIVALRVENLRLRDGLRSALFIASALNNKFRPHHQDSHYSEKLHEISWLLDDTEAPPPKLEGESDAE